MGHGFFTLAGRSAVSGADESPNGDGMDRGCHLARPPPRATDPLIHPHVRRHRVIAKSPSAGMPGRSTLGWRSERTVASHPLTIRVDRPGRTALVPGQHVRSFDPNRLQLLRVEPEQFQDGGRDLSRLDGRIDGA